MAGPPGSQASSRGEAKDSALLSSRDAGPLEPPERSESVSRSVLFPTPWTVAHQAPLSMGFSRHGLALGSPIFPSGCEGKLARIGDWLNNLCYVHTLEDYSALDRSQLLAHINLINLQGIMLSEKSQS